MKDHLVSRKVAFRFRPNLASRLICRTNDALDDVELVRGELNDLVAKSVARTEGRQNNVVFVKTHKTGSTTLASVVYRYGLRHGLRVARFDVEGTAVTLNHAAEQVRERWVLRRSLKYMFLCTCSY